MGILVTHQLCHVAGTGGTVGGAKQHKFSVDLESHPQPGFPIDQDRLDLEVIAVNEHRGCRFPDYFQIRLLSGSLCVKARPFGEGNDLCVTSVTF